MHEPDGMNAAVDRMQAGNRQPMITGQLPRYSGDRSDGRGVLRHDTERRHAHISRPYISIVAEDRSSSGLYLLRFASFPLPVLLLSGLRRIAAQIRALSTLSVLPRHSLVWAECAPRRPRCSLVRAAFAPKLSSIAMAMFCGGAIASVGRAQAVDAIGDESLTLPAGVTRLSIGQQDTRYDQHYGTNGLQPLGSYLTLDSLNVQQLPILGPLQNEIRSLAQDPTIGLTLGASFVESSVRVSVTPIGLDIGITRWLTLRASVPIVRSYDVVLFNPNANARTGNIGFNPALRYAAALAIDTALYGQFNLAGSSLLGALQSCQANPGSAGYCAALLAQQSAITSLVSQSNSFANTLSQVYGGNGKNPSVVVPVDSSGALNSINKRLQSFAAAYAHYDSLTGGPGITGPGPVGAPPIGLGDMTQLLTTNALGLGFDTLQTVNTTGIGDIDIGATALLLDSFHGNDSARIHPTGFNYRLATTFGFRIGTGQPNSPDQLVGVGTGTGANAVKFDVSSDLIFGRHWWTSLAVRSTFPLTDQVTARIPLGLGEEFAPLFTKQMVGRTLGRSLDFEIDQHYGLNTYFAITAQYRYLQTSMSRYTGVFTVDSAVTGFGNVTLNANALNAGTASTAQQWGIGLTFSTVASTLGHPGRLPLDVSYLHYQTFTGWAGAGGMLPRVAADAVQIRLYVRMFGHGASYQAPH